MYGANFPRVSLIGWLYHRRPTFLSPLFPPPYLARSLSRPSFSFFSVFTIHVQLFGRGTGKATTSDRATTGSAPPAPEPKREVCIFTRRSIPSGVSPKPTDRPTDQPTSLPFPLSFRLYICHTAWQRFVRRIAVEFLRDNLFEKYFSPFHSLQVHMDMHVCTCARMYTGAYAADAPRNCETSDIRESTIFSRIYVDYPARREPRYVSR